MRFTTILISIFLSTNSVTVYAQFGNLLKDLKGAAEALQKNVQEGTPNKENTSPSTNNTIGVVSADEYCKRFSNNPSVVALSQAMDAVGNPKLVAGVSNQHTFLDNANGDLEKWVASKLDKLPGRSARPPLNDSQLFNPLIEIINSCAKKTNVFLVGATANRFGDVETNFLLGGAITLDSGPGKIARGNKNPREATLLAFLFDGADEEIKKVSPNPVASFNLAADSIKQNQKRIADNKAAAAEKEAQASKRRAEAAAFNSSPDGQLLYSYQHFQIIQLCHDIRKGLAVQFVTVNEFTDFKSKMKQIENKLKGSVKDKNTDRIWKAAEENNRNFGSIEIDGKPVKGIDLIAAITSNNKSNWMSAKNDCDIQVEAFRGMIKDVLGNEQIKKSF
jgi:hypothetical protein